MAPFPSLRPSAFLLAAGLAGCAPDYSPNIYNANAVQQANKVDIAFVIGYRQVDITAAGTVGAISGGAAGGILGAQAGPGGVTTALAGIGGSVMGAIVGNTIEHAAADTTGWEYIVKKPNGDLLSVTQRQAEPIPIGQKVYIISGNQARIVPAYATLSDAPPPADKAKEAAKDAVKDKPDAKVIPATAPAAVAAPAPAKTPVPGATEAPVVATTLPPPAAPGEAAVPAASSLPAATPLVPPSSPMPVPGSAEMPMPSPATAPTPVPTEPLHSDPAPQPSAAPAGE